MIYKHELISDLPRLWRNGDRWPIPLKKYGDIGNFSGVTSVILPFMNLKYVGTLAPTARIISDFYVLDVPKTQPRHNLMVSFIWHHQPTTSKNKCVYIYFIAWYVFPIKWLISLLHDSLCFQVDYLIGLWINCPRSLHPRWVLFSG